MGSVLKHPQADRKGKIVDIVIAGVGLVPVTADHSNSFSRTLPSLYKSLSRLTALYHFSLCSRRLAILAMAFRLAMDFRNIQAVRMLLVTDVDLSV